MNKIKPEQLLELEQPFIKVLTVTFGYTISFDMPMFRPLSAVNATSKIGIICTTPWTHQSFCPEELVCPFCNVHWKIIMPSSFTLKGTQRTTKENSPKSNKVPWERDFQHQWQDWRLCQKGESGPNNLQSSNGYHRWTISTTKKTRPQGIWGAHKWMTTTFGLVD